MKIENGKLKEIVLHSNDSFEHVFVNEPEVNLHIVQESGSRVKIHVINMESSAISPQHSDIANKIVVEQAGEGCETEIYGLAYLKGEERVTTETHVYHTVGGGKSSQLIKFVLEDQSRGRFIGDLKIAPDAQQVEAHQTNRNLVLSDEAEMRTQPQLEIYADDVKASHGASTGQLDEAAMFYMQQRGIGKEKARQLLVNAFMKEVIEAISPQHSVVRDQLLNTVDGVVEQC